MTVVITLIKKVFGVFGKNWKLVGVSALVAVCGTSVYACSWERQKHEAASSKVTEARAELREAQARAAAAAVKVQESNNEATKRTREVDDAIQSNAEWGNGVVPDAVHDSLCGTIDCGEAG